MKKKKIIEEGITLLALVITIIILLILVGVTLNLVLGQTGLFSKAKNATDRYKKAQENETDLLIDLEKELEKIDRGELKVGDIVLYTPTVYVDNDSNIQDNGYTLLGAQSGYGTYSSTYPKTLDAPENQILPQETYTWKIFNIDESTGKVEIVGVPLGNGSYKEVYFDGSLGYNNGVYLLDDICKALYSNATLGVEARSIDLKDIEGKMSSEGKKENIPSGTVQTYTGANAYYPDLYNFQKGSGVNVTNEEGLKLEGINESDAGELTQGIPMNTNTVKSNGYSQATNITVEDTSIYKTQQESYYKDKAFYDMLFGTDTCFWIASRCSDCHSDRACFGLRNVYDGGLRYYDLFSSIGGYGNNARCICPIVSLGTDILLTKSEEGKWIPSKISK